MGKSYGEFSCPSHLTLGKLCLFLRKNYLYSLCVLTIVLFTLQGRVWGVAYQLRGTNQIRQALDHLGIRECYLGGYACETLTFTERMSLSNSVPRTIPVLTFIAVPSNALYLGPTGLDDLASQIVSCRGNSGTNVEYILRMAEYIHANIPEDSDEHLFALAQKIKERMDQETQVPSDDSNCSCLLESQKVLSLVTNGQDNEVDNQKQKMVEQLLLAFKALNNLRNLHDCNFQANLSTLQMEKFALSA